MVYLQLIKAEALKNNIPIMHDDTLNYIIDLINKHNIKTILEIGTATGYSSIYLKAHTGAYITSLEKDTSRYKTAVNCLKKYQIKGIDLINIDALNYEPMDTYDLIIIDAAKTKNQELFMKYQDYLNKNGFIITDNLNLGNIKNKYPTKNRLKLIEKTAEYLDFLKTNQDFNTEFIKVGDLISVSKRK